MSRPFLIDPARLLSLIERGLTDTQIASVLCVERSTVTKARYRITDGAPVKPYTRLLMAADNKFGELTGKEVFRDDPIACRGDGLRVGILNDPNHYVSGCGNAAAQCMS